MHLLSDILDPQFLNGFCLHGIRIYTGSDREPTAMPSWVYRVVAKTRSVAKVVVEMSIAVIPQLCVAAAVLAMVWYGGVWVWRFGAAYIFGPLPSTAPT